jgi:hypothetical protein
MWFSGCHGAQAKDQMPDLEAKVAISPQRYSLPFTL